MAADLLQEAAAPPPPGLATWRELPTFIDPPETMDEYAWRDAAEDAGLPEQLEPAAEAQRLAATTPPPPLAESEARKEHYLALLWQLEYEQKVGVVLPEGDIETVVGAALDAVRTGYLALPTKAAPRMVGLTSAAAAREVLTDLVHGVLSELAATEVLVQDVKDHGALRRKLKLANA